MALFLLFSSFLLLFFSSAFSSSSIHTYLFKSYVQRKHTIPQLFLTPVSSELHAQAAPQKNNAASTLIFRCPDVLNTSLPPFEIGRDLSAILRFRDSFAFSHLRRQTRRRSRRQGRRRGRRRSNRPVNTLGSPLLPLLSQRINNVPLQRLNEWLSRHQKTRSPPGRMFFLLFP